MLRRCARYCLRFWSFMSILVGSIITAYAQTNADSGTVVITEKSAVSLGMVIIISGVIGSWWSLKAALKETRLLLDTHVCNPGAHHTFETLAKEFMPRELAERDQSELARTLAAITATLTAISNKQQVDSPSR